MSTRRLKSIRRKKGIPWLGGVILCLFQTGLVLAEPSGFEKFKETPPRQFAQEVATLMTTLTQARDEFTLLQLLPRLERLAFEERDATAVTAVLPKLYEYLDHPSEQVKIAVLQVMRYLPDPRLLDRLKQMSGRPLYAAPETVGHPRSDMRLTWRGHATIAGRMVNSKLTLFSKLKDQTPEEQARQLMEVTKRYTQDIWAEENITTHCLPGEWKVFQMIKLGAAAVPACVEALEEELSGRVHYQHAYVSDNALRVLEQVADERARPIIRQLLDQAEKQKTTARGSLRRIMDRIEKAPRP